ncbi:MAG: deoxyribonucleoside regulator [Pseudonocardiales bacterium]|jgi:deoxyribonucleoside regulator|nr:deoxyribonucleoside regulator [Pseudonocardiales bacterium]MDQ1737054.1 deoxyribonucleoside regulator [Pseudonocardiales bacterium]
MQLRAAMMYYGEGATQHEISQQLGVSRATVGRLLASARDTGLVKIEIVSELGRQVGLELDLQTKYGLAEAVVIDAENISPTGSVDLGHGCADMLSRRLRPGMILGLGWSSDPLNWIARTSEVLRSDAYRQHQPKNIGVVQLAGSAPHDPTRVNPMRTVSAVAEALSAHELLISAPLYVDQAATVEGLRGDRGIRAALDAAGSADICMFGIGHVTRTAPLYINGYIDDTDLRELSSLEAVGDICGRFYDAKGIAVDGTLARRTLSVELDLIASRPLRIGVAAGLERVEAVRGAFAGGLANAIVTDTTTASALLQDRQG